MKMHIGKEIEQKFQESGLKLAVFADKINTGERNVYSIFKREDISADMLRKISEVLNYNFFEMYQSSLNQKTVNDTQEKYVTAAKKMNISFNISIPKNNLNGLEDFLKDLNSIAHKHGIDVN